MCIVVVGDLHIKNSEPHLYGLREFFKWLLNNHKDDIIIQLGDFFDTSSPFSSNEYEFIGYIKQFKQWHMLTGNHDISKRAGNSLLHIDHHDNIFIYDKEKEIIIDNKKMLMLPWKYNAKEDYEKLEGKYDYVFTHVTPPQCAFGDEGIKLKLEATYIHGHTHIQKDFIDKHKHFVIGIPVVTRNLENQEHRVAVITDKLSFEKVPTFFEYENVIYGEQPTDTHNIINVINAPSRSSVFDMYKDYYIRPEGIEVLRTENELKFAKEEQFESASLMDKFIMYGKEQNLPKEIIDTCMQYLRDAKEIPRL